MTSTKHKLIRERYTNCLLCGKEIEKPNFQRKYCSEECFEAVQKQKAIISTKKSQKKYKKEHPKEFKERKRVYQQRYLDKKRKETIQKRKAEDGEASEGTIKANCIYCGTEILIDEPSFISLFKTGRKIFCQDCRNKETMGCLKCQHFCRAGWYDDVCWIHKDNRIPLYCSDFKPKTLME